MTTHIIYHDFRNPTSAASGVMLTAAVLKKGRRLVKTVNAINKVQVTACVFLCSACITVSMLIMTFVAVA